VITTGITVTVPDTGPVPAAFEAFTEQVYDVPFVNPETVTGLDVPVPLIGAPVAAEQLAMYCVIGEPPLAGGVKLIDALPLPGEASPMVGAPGVVYGVTRIAADAAPAPTELLATTEQLYCVPFVRPVTTIGLAEPLFWMLELPETQVAV
jgi:hypothetical protein